MGEVAYERIGVRTEHEHYIEENDEEERDGIDRETRFSHPEGSYWHILPSGEEM